MLRRRSSTRGHSGVTKDLGSDSVVSQACPLGESSKLSVQLTPDEASRQRATPQNNKTDRRLLVDKVEYYNSAPMLLIAQAARHAAAVAGIVSMSR